MRYKGCLLLNYLKKIVRSPSRMMLTLSGLTISVVVLMTGLVFSETYLKSKVAEIEIYKTNYATVLEGRTDYDVYQKVNDLGSKRNVMELTSGVKHYVKKINQQGKKIDISVSDIRTNALNPDFLPDMSENGTYASRYKGALLYGRLITTRDIDEENKVTVIDSELAKFLFNTENAVGKRITFPVYKLDTATGTMDADYYEELNVIGVISASESTRKMIDGIFQSKEKDGLLEFYIYTPLSLKIAGKTNDDYTMHVVSYSEKEKYNEDSSAIVQLCSSSLFGTYTCYTYKTLLEEIQTEMESIRKMLFYIVIFMFVISAVSIVNTMMFSVKERINEIGIRKAIGAFDFDIIVQFLAEGLFYGIVSSVVGILLSLLLSSDIFLLLKENFLSTVYLVISKETVLLSFISSTTIGILAGIIPAVYASRIKITEAIKYD